MSAEQQAPQGTDAIQDPHDIPDPDAGHDPDDAQNQAPVDPWERFGWVMATIWLLFLGYPIANTIAADIPVWGQVLGVLGIIAFASVYILGFIRMARAPTQAKAIRIGIAHLAVMTLLTGALIPVLGIWVLSMSPFIVALVMFALPLRWAAGATVLIVAVALFASLATGELANTWFFIPIIAMVGFGNGLVVVLVGRQEAHQAMAEERQLMAERDRVARDVHDVLGHSLTVITVKAELAERLIDADPEGAKAELAEIQTLTRQSLAEVRATVAGLRAARLEDEVDRVRSALEGAGITAELPTDVTIVDPRHKIVLAWVLRELVTNVVRHSAASRCEVQLGRSWLRVMDDGVGMGEVRQVSRGNGLRGVTERIGCGELEIAAGPDGRGTVITVQMAPGEAPPLPASPAAGGTYDDDAGSAAGGHSGQPQADGQAQRGEQIQPLGQTQPFGQAQHSRPPGSSGQNAGARGESHPGEGASRPDDAVVGPAASAAAARDE